MRLRILFAAMLAASSVAFAQGDHAMTPNDPAAQAFMDANQAMMDAMAAMPSTGDPDKDFALMMTPHHEGAVAMAEVVLQYGDDPELRALAESIIKDQTEEIAWMREWLARQPE
jgi:uncharacterized protein (DUF305 family)